MTVPRPFLLTILDGWGSRASADGNAIMMANTPTMDHLQSSYPRTTLGASGEAVGLPSGQMGNSEVGHLNIGAGRLVLQDFQRVNHSISRGDFYRNKVLLSAIGHAGAHGSTLHLMGLLSDGGVHSHIEHIFAILEMAREAGLERVPVRVLAKTQIESLEIALIENLQREDLNSIEEARGYRRLLTVHRMTQAELADKVSKSRSAITNSLRLLDLPDEVQELVYENKMTAGHARAVLSVADEPVRLKLAQKIVDEGLSVRDAENLARLYAAGQTERAPRPATPKSYKTVARKLRRLLATNVRVKLVKDKGKIEIEFQGDEDLERIFRVLTQSEEPTVAHAAEEEVE